MNYMKKKYIKVFLPTILVISIVLFIVISTVIRKKDFFYYITKPVEYYLPNKNLNMNVNIYSNHQNDYYLQEEAIEKLVIKDQENQDFYTIKLKQIVEENKILIHDNKTFYQYRLSLELPLQDILYLQINQTVLEIYYLSEEVMSFDIGTIIIYNEYPSRDLNISHLKGVVNNIDTLDVLCGVGITLYSDASIVVNDIKVLNEKITIQGSNIKIIEDDNYENSQAINELLGGAYQVLDIEDSFTPFLIDKGEKKHYLLPLGYKEIISIERLGFLIEYTIENTSYTQLIEPFQFYKSYKNNYQVIKYEPNRNI